MSILRGSSVSYGRSLHAKITAADLDKTASVHYHTPMGPGDENLEAIGTCSWRNLLDGPVDRGWLPSQSAWVVGIRRDVKTAPTSILQAELAREFADAASVSKGVLSKAAKRSITAAVKKRLALAAQPKVSSGLIAYFPDRQLALWDCSRAAADWASSFLVKMEPFYYEPDYRGFLAWLIESVDEPESSYFLEGELSMRDAEGDGEDCFGMDVVDRYKALKDKGYTPRRLGITLPVGEFNASFVLDAPGLKVKGLMFPEFPGTIPDLTPEDRLSQRLDFILAVETALSGLVAKWIAVRGQGKEEPPA